MNKQSQSLREMVVHLESLVANRYTGRFWFELDQVIDGLVELGADEEMLKPILEGKPRHD